jgi:hypothetical protein
VSTVAGDISIVALDYVDSGTTSLVEVGQQSGAQRIAFDR